MNLLNSSPKNKRARKLYCQKCKQDVVQPIPEGEPDCLSDYKVQLVDCGKENCENLNE